MEVKSIFASQTHKFNVMKFKLQIILRLFTIKGENNRTHDILRDKIQETHVNISWNQNDSG